jgi:hypothetical protein
VRSPWTIAVAVVVVLAAAATGAYLYVQETREVETTTEQRSIEDDAIPFEAGVQAGRLDRDIRISAVLGAPVARVEWPIETPAAELIPIVAAYARAGVRVQPVSGYGARLPTRAEAQNVGTWARAVGPEAPMWRTRDPRFAVRAIEFGTETSFAYQGTQKRGGEYALRAREASIAASAAGVGLFIQADEANQADEWINQMYDAVPDLHRYAAAWIVHPYGPQWRRRLDLTIYRTEQRGAPRIPLAITEYGISNDGGRCLNDNYGWPRCLTSAQAAEILERVVREMRAEYPRIRQFLLYNNHDLRPPGTDDNREHYFGARRSNGDTKGAFTRAAERLMASGE